MKRYYILGFTVESNSAPNADVFVPFAPGSFPIQMLHFEAYLSYILNPGDKFLFLRVFAAPLSDRQISSAVL